MKKNYQTIGFLILFSCLLHVAASAPEFEAILSNPNLRMGESILYTIKAKWPKTSDSFAFLPPNPKLENLSVVRKGESQEVLLEDGKEWVLKTFEIEFKAEKPGKASILAFDLNYLSKPSQDSSSPALQTSGKFSSPEQTLFIQPIQKFSPVHLILASFAALGAGFGLFLVLARKKTAKNEIASAVPENLQVSALKKIQVLAENHSLGSKEKLHEASAQFRDFLNRHFELSLTTSSESDLIKKINESGKPEERILVRILERITEAKYALGTLSPEQVSSLIREITKYIEGTRVI